MTTGEIVSKFSKHVFMSWKSLFWWKKFFNISKAFWTTFSSFYIWSKNLRGDHRTRKVYKLLTSWRFYRPLSLLSIGNSAFYRLSGKTCSNLHAHATPLVHGVKNKIHFCTINSSAWSLPGDLKTWKSTGTSCQIEIHFST